MKAAILKAFGSPLSIETVPAPVLGTGEVIVDVVATRVLSYANEVFSGERKYALDLPVIPGPGGIGRVRELGPDATHLAVGDWVFCDPTVRSRDDMLAGQDTEHLQLRVKEALLFRHCSAEARQPQDEIQVSLGKWRDALRAIVTGCYSPSIKNRSWHLVAQVRGRPLALAM